eukprot:1744267-Amphidinium_carterae.1
MFKFWGLKPFGPGKFNLVGGFQGVINVIISSLSAAATLPLGNNGFAGPSCGASAARRIYRIPVHATGGTVFAPYTCTCRRESLERSSSL